MRQLVLVHGRSQEHKDSVALKAEWIEAWKKGLDKSNLSLPIPEKNIRFPFYGDTLFDLVSGRPESDAAEVIVRGTKDDTDIRNFVLAILRELQAKTRITDEQIAEVVGDEILERGPLNWEWVHGILKAVDRFVPSASGASIALATHDVYAYLKNSNIREKIETGIANAITPGVETVVVSHSLGTVAAYNLIRREGHLRGWKVPLFLTLGSPLGIKEIRKTLRGFAPTRCPECVQSWSNAMDERDVVALYPLIPKWFPLDPVKPEIDNKTDIDNHTENRHGIAGYLDDKEVAAQIYAALTA
jgi:hypothetical protein